MGGVTAVGGRWEGAVGRHELKGERSERGLKSLSRRGLLSGKQKSKDTDRGDEEVDLRA